MKLTKDSFLEVWDVYEEDDEECGGSRLYSWVFLDGKPVLEACAEYDPDNFKVNTFLATLAFINGISPKVIIVDEWEEINEGDARLKEIDRTIKHIYI